MASLRSESNFFVVESGEHTWLEVSEGIAHATKHSNLLMTTEIKRVSLKAAADFITAGDESIVEITFASMYYSPAMKFVEVSDDDGTALELGWISPVNALVGPQLEERKTS